RNSHKWEGDLKQCLGLLGRC
ncbi:hypothetical protein V3C99_014641, partial [Haemonchus contortus]